MSLMVGVALIRKHGSQHKVNLVVSFVLIAVKYISYQIVIEICFQLTFHMNFT